MQQAVTSYADLPLTLSAKHLTAALGISRAGIYRLMQTPGFPLLRVGGRVLVPRERFLRWMDAQIVEKDPIQDPKIGALGDSISA
ncbi:MAG: helix-turn-helix domain-containing protein [Ruthenibacterium sp.]